MRREVKHSYQLQVLIDAIMLLAGIAEYMKKKVLKMMGEGEKKKQYTN